MKMFGGRKVGSIHKVLDLSQTKPLNARTRHNVKDSPEYDNKPVIYNTARGRYK